MIVKRQNKPLEILINPSKSATAQLDIFNSVFGEDATPKHIVTVQNKAFFGNTFLNKILLVDLLYSGFY